MHWRCFLRMAWLNRREWYVFEELGGFWAWMRWWPTTLKEYRVYEPGTPRYPGICGYCDIEQAYPDTLAQKVQYIFRSV
jgi:hypothetical protein